MPNVTKLRLIETKPLQKKIGEVFYLQPFFALRVTQIDRFASA